MPTICQNWALWVIHERALELTGWTSGLRTWEKKRRSKRRGMLSSLFRMFELSDGESELKEGDGWEGLAEI